MPFDPISWGAGYLLTQAATKGLEVTFPQDLRYKLTDIISAWAQEVSRTAYIIPEVFFSNIYNQHEDLQGRPFLAKLKEELLNLNIPSKELWLMSFLEQWSEIKTKYGVDAQPFFQLSESEAKVFLEDLAQKLYNACIKEEKIAIPHIVNKLNAITVTLDELRYLNLLRAFPLQAEPDLDSNERIIQTAVGIALSEGMDNCIVMEQQSAFYGKSFWLHFFNSSDVTQILGVLQINSKQAISWSSLGTPLLISAIYGAMFKMPLFTGIDENWNNMVEYIGRVSRSIYPNCVYDNCWGISADYFEKSIGVPLPVGHPYDKNDRRIKMLALSEGDLVPFYCFPEDHLNQLLGKAEIEASGIIAKWLFKQWGLPTFRKFN